MPEKSRGLPPRRWGAARQKAALMAAPFALTRVSTDKQDAEYQFALLEAAGVPRENIFTDSLTGKSQNRPGFKALNAKLRRGDVVYFTQLSRIGRNQRETVDWLVGEQDPPGLEKRGIQFYILNNRFLSTPESELPPGMPPGIRRVVLELLAYLAEEELAQKSFATSGGMRSRMARGMKPGRPPISHRMKEMVRTLHAQGWSFEAIHKELGIGRSTVTRYARDPDYNPIPPRRDPTTRGVRGPYKPRHNNLFAAGIQEPSGPEQKNGHSVEKPAPTLVAEYAF